MKYLTTIIIAMMIIFVAWVWCLRPIAKDAVNNIQPAIDNFNSIINHLS